VSFFFFLLNIDCLLFLSLFRCCSSNKNPTTHVSASDSSLEAWKGVGKGQKEGEKEENECRFF